MKRRIGRAAALWVGAIWMALALSASSVRADKPAMVLEGDGLKVVITNYTEETGVLRGVIQRQKESWPFEGKEDEDDTGDLIRGHFTAGEAKFRFTARQVNDTDFLFVTDNRTYRLKMPAEAPPPPPGVPNPLADEKTPPNPLGDSNAPPAPVPAPSGLQPNPQPAGNQAAAAFKADSIRLSLHHFPDATMGAPAAYAVLLPEGWQASGHVEWQPVGELLFPQQRFEIRSPRGGKITYVPAVTMAYANAPALGQRQGEPAPDNFPQWLTNTLGRATQTISNLQLVDAKRQEHVERQMDENDRATGAIQQGTRREAWLITLEYDEAGIRRRDELTIVFVAYQPFRGLNGFVSQSWAFWTNQIVSAPAASFEKDKPELYAVCQTVRTTPGWFLQSQAIIREASQRRSAEIWETIKKRGQQINNRLSDAEYRAYKNTVNSDAAQRTRIKTIWETDDFRDTNGEIVNLPMHYKHVFSDGNGKYVLTNNSLDKPGELWTEIQRLDP